ncbi:MAG TPA: FAD-binding oxidoreductase [Streptosporangiaceae bacterium]|nr:FAD-binding oxidoreductase [Streptosporangiaceae bacterium]
MADPLAALEDVCAAVRPGGPADAVFGVVPAVVASPATVAEASGLLRAAAGHGLAVLPRGTGTKLSWGTPPDRCDLAVDTTRLDKIIEHAAGDLVVRVQAGLPMARLAGRLAPAGQQLALDTPRGGSGGTVGGVIATGAAGPRRLRHGAPRDLLIGITVVLAGGTVASSGGKVVKNVAGYDLGKLFAGSHGTLGLIAEAAFRLHPLPQAAAYVTVTCATAAGALGAVRAAIESQLGPSAAEIDRPAPSAPVSVSVLLEGTADAVTERVTRMRDILGTGAKPSADPPAWWGAGVAADGATELRIAFPPGALEFVLRAVDEAAAGPGPRVLIPAIRGSAGCGVLEAGLGAQTPPDAAASFVATLRRRLAAPPGWGDVPGASVTVVRAPAEIRSAVDVWGPVNAAEVMRAVKDQFDPDHVMSPGRFAGGI